MSAELSGASIMVKKLKKSGNRNLPSGSDLPPDEHVNLPSQATHAAAVADALARSQPVPPKPQPKARPGFPHNDAEIDNALEQLRAGVLQPGSPGFGIVWDLAEEGANHIKSVRRGARKPRGKSDVVTRRMEAELQAYRELSPKRQAHPTGTMTLQDLHSSLEKKGFNVPEDTLRHDLQQLGPILRLVREGIVPPPGPKPVNQKLSKKTQQEMLAGRRTLARHRSGR